MIYGYIFEFFHIKFNTFSLDGCFLFYHHLNILQITTRSSTFPLQNWDWELAFIQSGGNLSTSYSITSSNRSLPDDLTIELKGVDIDQQRSVEYVIMIINDKQVLKTFSGKKTFTKSR
jgi:hypothetical protein